MIRLSVYSGSSLKFTVNECPLPAKADDRTPLDREAGVTQVSS